MGHTVTIRAFFLSLSLMVSCTIMQAQTIPNGDFENWLFQGSFYDPQDWLTYNGDLENAGAPSNVTRDSASPHKGKYGMALKTVMITGYGLFPGYSQTDFSLTVTPSAINGWFKYDGPGDTGVMYSRIFRRTQTNQLHPIKEGYAIFTGNITGYTSFSLAYYDKDYPNETPDSCYIYMFSGKHENSKLTVDDLSFGPVLSVHPVMAITDMQLYPNPASNIIFVSAEGKTPASVTIKDLAGKTVLVSYNNSNIDISELECGVYVAEVMLNGKLGIQKIIKS